MVENTRQNFVVDASFILAFLLKEKPSVGQIFRQFIEGKIEFLSTIFLKFEVGNGLRSAVLRKKLTKNEAKKLYQDFFNFKISEMPQNYFEILDCALEKKVSFYDASYLSLSKNLSAKLLTLDKILGKNS